MGWLLIPKAKRNFLYRQIRLGKKAFCRENDFILNDMFCGIARNTFYYGIQVIRVDCQLLRIKQKRLICNSIMLK